MEYNLNVKALPHCVKKPAYSRDTSACFDICAALDSPVLLFPSKRFKCPTGLEFNLPENVWLQIQGRSGLATEEGIIPIGGVIDNYYNGEVFVTLLNSNSPVYKYIGLKNIKSVKVEGLTISCLTPYGTKEYHINNTFLNVSGNTLLVDINSCKVQVKNGQLFKINNMVVNVYDYVYTINPGDKIAQVEVKTYNKGLFNWVDDVQAPNKYNQGFGSSGK